MTRQELEGFIRYLREKEEVRIDPYCVRTLFVRRMYLTDKVCLTVAKIRAAASEEEAYRTLAFSLPVGYSNPENRLLPTVVFKEDLYDHLLVCGFEEERAAFWSDKIASGGYKSFCRKHPKEIPLEGELHVFATACQFMPGRDKITEILKTEYALYSE